MSTAGRLSDRFESLVRHGEAQPAAYLSMPVYIKKAIILRAFLRLCDREGVRLRHGSVKHARDTIRHIERTVNR